MMINPANRKNNRKVIIRKSRFANWANKANRASSKSAWAQVIAITSLSLFSCYMPAMASLVPPIELPNLDWVINPSQKSTEKPVKVVERPTNKVGSPLGSLSLEKKQSLIAQLSQEILADSKEYINHPKTVFLSSLTSDKHSIEYLKDIVSQLEKTGANLVPENVLKKGIKKQVIVSIIIDNQGTLLESSIQQSSDVIEIDEAALKIIELAAPYRSLPEIMSARYDQANIIRTFFFDGGE